MFCYCTHTHTDWFYDWVGEKVDVVDVLKLNKFDKAYNRKKKNIKM